RMVLRPARRAPHPASKNLEMIVGDFGQHFNTVVWTSARFGGPAEDDTGRDDEQRVDKAALEPGFGEISDRARPMQRTATLNGTSPHRSCTRPLETCEGTPHERRCSIQLNQHWITVQPI